MRRLQVWLALVVLLVSSVGVNANTVTFWTQYATQPWMPELMERFTAETGIAVDLRQVGWGTDEFYIALAADAAPDVFTHGMAALGAFASLDALTPLDAALERWSFADGIVKQGLESGVYEGRQMALPFSGMDVRDLIYRADFFEEAGLGADVPPTTWSELVEYGKKLVKYADDGTLIRSGLHVWTEDQMYSMFLHQSGGSILTDGVSTLTTDAAIDALEYHASLVLDHQLDVLGFSQTTDVLTGRAAMVWTSPGFWFRNDEGVENLRVATFPYSKQPASFLSTAIMMAPKSAANPEAALELIRFLLHPDQQSIINQGAGLVPLYREAIEWDWLQSVPVAEHFIQVVSYAYPNPAHEKWFDIRGILQQAVNSALRGEVPPVSALTNANERIAALLDN